MNIKTRPFTQDEFQKLLWVAPDPWRSIFQIAYLTGLRISDLLEIPYSEPPIILRITEKKTGTIRKIDVNLALRTCWNNLLSYSSGVYLFPYRDASSYRKAIYRYCLKAQINLDRIAFHSIRKTCATDIYNRFGLVPAFQFLGHKRITTTMEYIEVSALEINNLLELTTLYNGSRS